MKKFIDVQNQNTLPLILYCLSSLFIIFIKSLVFLIPLYIFFCILTILLTENFLTFFKISKITLLTIAIYFFVFSILEWDLSFSNFEKIFPKGVSLSILISTGIIVFDVIPTIQLLKITKFVFRNENVVYAMLSGFRTFPVLLNISKKTLMAQKIRGVSKKKILSILLYLYNVLINFFEFFSDFKNQIEYMDIKEAILLKNRISIKFLFFFMYSMASILGGIHEF